MAKESQLYLGEEVFVQFDLTNTHEYRARPCVASTSARVRAPRRRRRVRASVVSRALELNVTGTIEQLIQTARQEKAK